MTLSPEVSGKASAGQEGDLKTPSSQAVHENMNSGSYLFMIPPHGTVVCTLLVSVDALKRKNKEENNARSKGFIHTTYSADNCKRKKKTLSLQNVSVFYKII